MLSRWQPQQQEIDARQLLDLAREAESVISRVTHDHDYWSYQPAQFACCYAIIRIGEGVRRLDRRSRRRLRSASLAIWAEWRNYLAHDLEIQNYALIHRMINAELPLLLRDLERLGA